MKNVILIFLFSFFLNNRIAFCQKDIGYKENCFEYYYPNIVYGNLLKLLDTNTKNNFIGNNKCKFFVSLTLNTVTGCLEDVKISDSCNLLTTKKKIEFVALLNKIKFNICHDDYWRRDKKARSIYEKTIKFSVGSFKNWWYKKSLHK